MSYNISDLTISNISFVVRRETSASWKSNNIANKRNFLLIYALNGCAFYTADGMEFKISQGDIIFFNKGIPHSGYSSPENPWTYYTIGFDAVTSDGVQCDELPLPMLTHISNQKLFHRLYETLYFEWTAQDAGYSLYCKGIISEIITMLIRENGTSHKKIALIEQITRYMITHFTENLSIEKLADMANISQSHFHRLFKENIGVSAKQYLNSIRINQAQMLLQSGEYTVSEIADMVGFNDIYYFSRLFKKITGVPPSAFLPK